MTRVPPAEFKNAAMAFLTVNFNGSLRRFSRMSQRMDDLNSTRALSPAAMSAAICWSTDFGANSRKAARAASLVQVSQSSRIRPGTRENSRVLWLTRTSLRLMAMAANEEVVGSARSSGRGQILTDATVRGGSGSGIVERKGRKAFRPSRWSRVSTVPASERGTALPLFYHSLRMPDQALIPERAKILFEITHRPAVGGIARPLDVLRNHVEDDKNVHIGVRQAGRDGKSEGSVGCGTRLGREGVHGLMLAPADH
jgi:hypothetical protein